MGCLTKLCNMTSYPCNCANTCRARRKPRSQDTFYIVRISPSPMLSQNHRITVCPMSMSIELAAGCSVHGHGHVYNLLRSSYITDAAKAKRHITRHFITCEMCTAYTVQCACVRRKFVLDVKSQNMHVHHSKGCCSLLFA